MTTMVTMFRGNQYPCRDKGYLNQQHNPTTYSAQRNTLRGEGGDKAMGNWKREEEMR